MIIARHFSFGMLVMPLVFLGIAVAIASSVATPNTFVAGTPAVAADVNANFMAHEAAINDNDTRITANLNRIWAERDDNSAGVNNLATDIKTINSILIDVPADGFLVISGTVFINNQEATVQRFELTPRVDGVDAVPSWGASADAGVTGADDQIHLSYTVAVAITAGAHTISQIVDPTTGPIDWFNNAEHLVIQFFATGSVTAVNSP